ncbi:hypothetical protein X777_06345 [Ooceraea biroi]|uniref:Uncharacterized protein n=1 Tax=Ooceraea biroi TaxID=2015173 RepID=A0A026WC68_OOCBI|nr:hypothetical protein X777_06345 [Ooceraea biroi]
MGVCLKLGGTEGCNRPEYEYEVYPNAPHCLRRKRLRRSHALIWVESPAALYRL